MYVCISARGRTVVSFYRGYGYSFMEDIHSFFKVYSMYPAALLQLLDYVSDRQSRLMIVDSCRPPAFLKILLGLQNKFLLAYRIQLSNKTKIK
jgi:hypothetical protein